jgi:hypothetical protein
MKDNQQMTTTQFIMIPYVMGYCSQDTNSGMTNNRWMKRFTTRHGVTMALLAIVPILVTAGTMMTMTIYQGHYNVKAFPQGYDRESYNYAYGTISSIQNDENGKPTWVVVGPWKSNLLSNQSSVSGEREGNVTSPSAAGSSFDTQFEMVRLDGTATHTHTITNFMLANMSQPNNMTKVFNGTATASTREGPVTDIPTSIKIIGNKVISIWLDPSKIDNHFGNTPIYGLVMDDHRPPIGPFKDGAVQMDNSSLR